MTRDLCWHVSPQIRCETSNSVTSRELMLKCLHSAPERDFSSSCDVHFHYLHNKRHWELLETSTKEQHSYFWRVGFWLRPLFEADVKQWERSYDFDVNRLSWRILHIIITDVKLNTIHGEWLSSWVRLWFLPRCTALRASPFIYNGKIWRLEASQFVLKMRWWRRNYLAVVRSVNMKG